MKNIMCAKLRENSIEIVDQSKYISILCWMRRCMCRQKKVSSHIDHKSNVCVCVCVVLFSLSLCFWWQCTANKQAALTSRCSIHSHTSICPCHYPCQCRICTIYVYIDVDAAACFSYLCSISFIFFFRSHYFIRYFLCKLHAGIKCAGVA